VIRRERLAQCAGVELVHPVVGQVGQALVTEVVGFARFFQPFGVQFWVGVNRHLDLIDNRAEVFVEAGVQDFAEVLQVEAFVGGGVRNADPGDIALADVLDAGGTVDKIVHLSFEHRLEVRLHLAASHLDDDTHVHVALWIH
jgi:hypothetical protein